MCVSSVLFLSEGNAHDRLEARRKVLRTDFSQDAACPGAGLPVPAAAPGAVGPASLPGHRVWPPVLVRHRPRLGEKWGAEEAPGCFASRARRAVTRGNLAPCYRVFTESRVHTMEEMLRVCRRHVLGEGLIDT